MWSSGIVHETRGAKGSAWLESESAEFLVNISARILEFSTECVKVWLSFIQCGKDEVFRIFHRFDEWPEVLAAFAIITNFTSQLLLV